MTLIELSDLEKAAFEALTRENDEGQGITEDEQFRIIDEWIAADADFKSKVDRYCDLITALNARANYRGEQARAISRLAASDSGIAEKIKRRLHSVMNLRDERKIETDHHVLTVVNNGGKLPVVVPAEWRQEPAKAPEQFHRHKIELDVRAIGDALEAGEVIEGCGFGERGTNLRIK